MAVPACGDARRGVRGSLRLAAGCLGSQFRFVSHPHRAWFSWNTITMTALLIHPIPAACTLAACRGPAADPKSAGATTARTMTARAIATCASAIAAVVLACVQPAQAEGKLPAADPAKGQQIVGGGWF